MLRCLTVSCARQRQQLTHRQLAQHTLAPNCRRDEFSALSLRSCCNGDACFCDEGLEFFFLFRLEVFLPPPIDGGRTISDVLVQ